MKTKFAILIGGEHVNLSQAEPKLEIECRKLK